MLATKLDPAGPKPWAEFSVCGRYRYVLAWPTGIGGDKYALFILANPSTATEDKTDPTVTRTINFARRWGFGWSHVVNCRAWRETNPKLLPPDPLAIGPDNDEYIAREVAGAGLVVCGWGALGGDRGTAVLTLLRGLTSEIFALRLNSDGAPAHPLSRGKGAIRSDALPIRI
jgi:hypothetical protein